MGEPYADWQQRLEGHFFTGVAGKPVLLFVDDDELQRIAPDPQQPPAKHLACAVHSLVAVGQGRAMFRRVNAEVEQWRKGSQDRPPPVLPVVALSVLAATRMRTDTEARSSNYYLRLAQALLPDAGSDAIDRIRRLLREGGAFTDVAQMWHGLDEWLRRQEGRWGVSTIRDHPGRTRIGNPLSQALLRRSDRAALTRFFAALELDELSVPAPPALLKHLRLWASRPRGLSDAFKGALADDDLCSLLMPLVTALAERWDGRVVTADGKRRLEMHLVLDLEKWAAHWAIPVIDGVAYDLLTGTVADTEVRATIEQDSYSRMYRLSGGPGVTREALKNPFRLSGAAAVAEFSPMDVRPFVGDADSGGWVSVAAVIPYQELVITATSHRATDVEQFLRLAADPGWRHVQQRTQPLLEGSVLFTDVVFSDRNRLAEAVRQIGPGLSAIALPDATARPRLVRGLPVARNMLRHCFLTDGEPDLLIPIGTEPRSVAASLDGNAQDPPFLAAGFPIPLRNLGLEPGEHRLVVDGEQLRFTLVQAAPGQGLPAGTGELAWEDSELVTTDGLAADCQRPGAGLDQADPVLARRDQDETWIVHANGRCEAVEEPAPPASLSERVPDLIDYYFELAPPQTAAWLAQRRGPRWRVSAIRDCEPRFEELDENSRAVWRQLAYHGPGTAPAWSSYVDAWECADGR